MENQKKYDLEERTEAFARNVRSYVRNIQKDIPNIEDSKQVVRSSGSVAANYIEANEALSKKDFRMRIKISRKEAKESRLWLRLIKDDSGNGMKLAQEATELMNIFGAILRKTE